MRWFRRVEPIGVNAVLTTAVPPHIQHLDAACLVAVKPAGLLAVPGLGEHGQLCLSAQVQALHTDALIVHRLDMATSGLMLFARGAEAQRRLSAAFADRRVHKRYIAVVHGRIEQADGVIDLPLMADWPNRPLQKVDRVHGKPSLTRYRVLGTDAAANTTRLELEPVTGRAHQLRVHLLAIGHPIVGDTLYGPPADALAAPRRMLLHATRLVFPHPVAGTLTEVRSTPPF
jgi:tRNA pseudouridine32 synthase / 23S rRNA pseudouridine746 synthase